MTIQVQRLTKIYGEQNALDGISFEAGRGEVVGFLGPNGAGKTTTMKILTCFLPQTSGSAEVCGFDVIKNPIEARRNIGYLPEHNPLYKDMYVKEYLYFVAGLHQTPHKKKRVDEMIERTGLTSERYKLIGSLSKGYQQRVGLAQAMIHDPAVLILDEPTSGLDPNQLVEIRRLIKELGKEKTVLFSTHIMQEAQSLCDRVLIINKGKIVADSPIESLQSILSGEKKVTVEFTESVSKAQLLKIKGVHAVEALGKDDRTWRLTSVDQTDIRPGVFQFAVSLGLTLLEMRMETTTVEDVFQELTK